MPYKDKTTYQSWVNANVNTNGVNAITGAIMNTALIDLSDSVNWGIAQQAKAVAISTTPLVVTFPVAMPSDNYALMIRPFDAGGDPIDYNIVNITAAGFTITGAVSGSVDWYATHQ